METSKLQNQTDHWQHFQTGDFGQKWNSSKLIVREGRGAIAPLLALLNDPTADAETHWFTIRALGHFPDPDVIAAIAAQIDDTAAYPHRTAEQATELSTFAIETLAAMGAAAIEVLSQLLESPQRRLLAAKALNQVRSSGVIPAMIGVAQDEDAQVRYYAIDALGSFHSAVVTPVLLAALTDPAATVRKAAVMALGRRRDLQTQCQLSQQLQPLLWDVDLAVSCQTALALGRLGTEDTLEALQQVLLSAHTPMALRIDTVRALEWYCDGRSGDQSQSCQRAFTLLTQALSEFSSSHGEHDLDQSQRPSPSQKTQLSVAIIRVLGDLHQGAMAPQATHSLIHHLQNQPDVAVVQAIIMALASLNQPQSFDALLPLLHHPADTIAIHTIAALKRLDSEQSLERVTTYLHQLPGQPTDVLTLW
ncbi:HEAT repeat domain-containing protein [Leptolyngbya cf. ectocarpi LEGE 11479]|uniref:HEAT repeat domain-containing protein n=1 Tax=Leptolyngbya cf. ectocarpi LEGE 11479 TaxID=1828722 RepID=A0A928ZV29_LEPEC|nr:HEAT repeat domain-containing protein [Leptolyngbya ectocarpi]MBE9067920.1 HEAT repeat domain-containing protein [Leptolyngbya cf. ectocarpi LEGE 11479]